jgi:hypothetical protein
LPAGCAEIAWYGLKTAKVNGKSLLIEGLLFEDAGKIVVFFESLKNFLYLFTT